MIQTYRILGLSKINCKFSVMDNDNLMPPLENEDNPADSAQTTEAQRKAELEKKLKAQEKNLKNEIID